jgi:hypothetical protein
MGCLLVAGPVSAQGLSGRYDVAIGARWTAAMPLDTPDATLTTASGGRVLLFATGTELEPVRALEARVSVRLTRFFRVEGSVSSGMSKLTTRVTSDFEGAPDVAVSEEVRELTVEGALVTEFPGRRAAPFLSAGAGYLNHVHEGRSLVEAGRMYHVGGGVSYLLWPGRATAIGLRGDLRVVVRTGGVASDRRARLSPAAGGSLFVRF